MTTVFDSMEDKIYDFLVLSMKLVDGVQFRKVLIHRVCKTVIDIGTYQFETDSYKCIKCNCRCSVETCKEVEVIDQELVKMKRGIE